MSDKKILNIFREDLPVYQTTPKRSSDLQKLYDITLPKGMYLRRGRPNSNVSCNIHLVVKLPTHAILPKGLAQEAVFNVGTTKSCTKETIASKISAAQLAIDARAAHIARLINFTGTDK